MENILYDVIILGSGCAGLTAGIYTCRANMKTLILESSQIGGQASIANEIENYPGIPKVSGAELMEKMLEQAKSFGADFKLCTITSVNLNEDIKEIVTSLGVYKSHCIILATGATPKKLGFIGEEKFTGRGVGYCATCDGFFYKNKDIFVIGGGNSAAEEALFLTRFGKTVTIVVRKDALRCERSLADKVLSHPKIKVKFNTEIIKAFGEDKMKGAEFKNNLTNETYTYNVSNEDDIFGIFVFIGYQPSSSQFQGQINIDQLGYILTDDNMNTSVKGVYAAGDVRPKQLRQLVTATSDGAIAAISAEKYLLSLK